MSKEKGAGGCPATDSQAWLQDRGGTGHESYRISRVRGKDVASRESHMSKGQEAGEHLEHGSRKKFHELW